MRHVLTAASIGFLVFAPHGALASHTRTYNSKIVFETGRGANRDQGGDGLAFINFEVPSPSFFVVHSALNIDNSSNFHGVRIPSSGGSSCTHWVYRYNGTATQHSYCVSMRKSGPGRYLVRADDKSVFPGTQPVRTTVEFYFENDGTACSIQPISASRSFFDTAGQFAGSIVSSECTTY